MSLSKATVQDPPGRFTGITNLFFSDPDSTVKVAFPKEWKNVQADVLTTTTKPVHIFRFKNADGVYNYFIDLDDNNRIEEKEQLIFHADQQNKIADFDITIPGKKGKTRKVAFQVLQADKYVYGRIKEQRSGALNLNNQQYKVVLRPQSRRHTTYSKKQSQLFIDLNRDTALNEMWSITNLGPARSEAIFLLDPFKIGDKGFIVDSIDAAGEWISIKPFSGSEAISEGYVFPALQLTGIDGKPLAIANNNKYTLIEMWSVNCHFCESIRGKLNALQTDMGEQLNWITISREQQQPVTEFLREHPMNSKTAIATQEQWNYLNPSTVTPLFYLLDSNGNIVLKAAGATVMNVIEMIVKEK